MIHLSEQNLALINRIRLDQAVPLDAMPIDALIATGYLPLNPLLDAAREEGRREERDRLMATRGTFQTEVKR